MSGKDIQILVIDEDDGSLLVEPFAQAGYSVSHETVATSAALEDALRVPKWDVVLAACNTPDLAVASALAQSRARLPDTPFLVVADAVTDEEAGALIEAGASDVLPRRAPARLVPRVERAMRATVMRRQFAAMQTAFAESEARLDTIAWNVPGLIYQLVLSPNGALALPYVSEGAYALLGVRPEVLREEPSLLLQLISPEDVESFGATMRESAERLADWNWEGRVLVGEQRETKWVNLRASARAAEGGAVRWEGMMWNITNSKRAELDLLASRRELQALSAHLETIKEQERASIAREIHDDIGGTLTAIKIDLVWVAGRMKDAPKALREKLASLEGLVDQAMTTSTQIARSLRPTILDFGVVAAIEWQAEEFGKRMGIECRLTCIESEIDVDNETALALFRIFQESLTNIAKHAGAGRVDVILERRDNDLVLQVADDGRGLVPEDLGKPRSFGIRGMLERARALGGEVEVSAGREGGTTVRVRLPVRERADLEITQEIPRVSVGKNIRVLIVDDHEIVRRGLKQILSETRDIVVSGEAETARDAVRLTREGEWDVTLLDISLPDKSGIDTLKLIVKDNPKRPVLMLSMHPEDHYAVRCLKAGAAGYLTKQSAPAQLVKAIRQVVAGRKYISAVVAEELANTLTSRSDQPAHATLSDREFQTLRLIATGHSLSEIAAQLALSTKTVSVYRARLLQKLALKNNAEIAHYAVKNGLVE